MSRVEHEPPSQRLHFRVQAPATITIDGVDYPAADWSLGGFLIDRFEGTVQAGEHLISILTINFQGFHISIRKEVVVVRVEADRSRIACRFIEVTEREKELLNYYISNLVTGQMAPVDDVIRRIDTPVKPVPLTPDDKVAESVPLHRQSLRRAVFSILYIVAGVLLGIFLVLTLYSHFFRVDVESAVVTRTIEQVVSKDLGVVQEILVTEGQHVSQGQVLLRLQDDQLARELEICHQELEDARLGLATSQERGRREEDRLAAYSRIAAEKLNSAREGVESLREQLRIADLELQRSRGLYESGIGSQSAYDEAAGRKATLAGELEHAMAELGIAMQAVDSVRKGFFYDGRSLVGQMPEAEVDTEHARRLIPILERRLSEVEQRAKRLEYRAAFPAKVLRLTKTAGNTTERGETLVLLEKTGEDPVVDVFLTQSAASYVQLGSQARILIPALDLKLKGEVVSVDRTYGFRAGLQDAYNWRHAAGTSAHVRIALTGLNPDLRARLAGGMPAIVNLPRSLFLRAFR